MLPRLPRVKRQSCPCQSCGAGDVTQASGCRGPGDRVGSCPRRAGRFDSGSVTQSGCRGSSRAPLLSCLQTMHFSAPRRSRGVFDKASCCKARQVLNPRAKFSKQIKEEAPSSPITGVSGSLALCSFPATQLSFTSLFCFLLSPALC